MVVFTASQLIRYCSEYPLADPSLRSWLQTVIRSDWSNPNDLKAEFGIASILFTNHSTTRVVFSIKGNDYRLVVDILFKKRTVFLTWFGNHSQYDKIDFTTYQRPPD